MEQQNDERLDALYSKINSIKNVDPPLYLCPSLDVLPWIIKLDAETCVSALVGV